MIELLVKGGVDIFRAIRMVLPPAWQNIKLWILMLEDFMNITLCIWSHGTDQQELLWLMENGHYVFLTETDSGQQGFKLDKDNIITIASETGVNPVDESNIVQKGRVAPGGMLAIDTSKGKIFDECSIDDELKQNTL